MFFDTFIRKFILPKSHDEDSARREFILNILLSAIIFLLIFVVINNTLLFFGDHVIYKSNVFPVGVVYLVFILFVSFYFLSRKGFSYPVSYALLITFFLPVTYSVYKWGIDLPAALLSYALIIVIAGVLISTRFTFLTTAVIVATMSLMSYTEHIGVFKVDRYWRSETWILIDIIFTSILFFIVATVSWLSNREIEKSLIRARRSEADLKKERDSLEITVEARTRELKETQAEKITQLYRFAEFGRLSSGLFHDLINPLNAVSLNLEQAKDSSETKQYVNKAVRAAKRLEDLVASVKKQLSRQESKALFSLNVEVNQAIEVLSYKAMKANVALYFPLEEDITTYGDPVKFNQVMLNLLANAIDARGKTVHVFLGLEKEMIVLSVKDDGVGILEENKQKIFEPFFTTKTKERGIGIGLSITKRIIEKDFGGSIEVASKEGEGSVFTIKFPHKDNG